VVQNTTVVIFSPNGDETASMYYLRALLAVNLVKKLMSFLDSGFLE